MRIAVLSDIHGNLPALKEVMDDIAEQQPDEIYSLGDQIGFYPGLTETLDLLDRTGVICLQGNHEEAFIKYKLSNKEQVKEYWYHRSYDWIETQHGHRDFSILPRVLHIEREGIKIVMSHMEEWAECPDDGLYLFGHTHEKLMHRTRSKYIVNPGAVGDPLGSYQRPEAHYVMLEILDGVIQVVFRAIPYSVESFWQSFIDSGCYEIDPVLSRLLMEMLETGVSNSIFGRYISHAKNIMQVEGVNSEQIPTHIWEKTSEEFKWMYPDKFEQLKTIN